MKKYLILKDARYRIRLSDGQAQSRATQGPQVPGKYSKWRPIKHNKLGYAKINNKQRNGKCRQTAISHLVLETIGKRRPDPPCDNALHKNDKPWDNRPCNLRWGTKKENRTDRDLNGNDIIGEKSPRAVLTERIVLWCRFAVENKIRKVSELAKEYGVTHESMRLAVYGINWKHLNGINWVDVVFGAQQRSQHR